MRKSILTNGGGGEKKHSNLAQMYMNPLEQTKKNA